MLVVVRWCQPLRRGRSSMTPDGGAAAVRVLAPASTVGGDWRVGCGLRRPRPRRYLSA